MESILRKKIAYTVSADYFHNVTLPYLRVKCPHIILDYVFVDKTKQNYEHIIANPISVDDNPDMIPSIRYDEVHIYGTRSNLVQNVVMPLIREKYHDYAEIKIARSWNL